tara:strand:- start:690 stop:1547 length:858 start_codon:yes stop_codon:yes gene_type:complete
MERGIIITPDYKVLEEGRGIQFNSGVNPENLRKYLLFWDRIDYPVNNLIHIDGGPDLSFLIQEGVAKSTMVKFAGMTAEENGLLPLATQLAAFDTNTKSSEEEWSIAQPSQRLTIPKSRSKMQGCLEFELYEAIQIPTREVPIEDIIRFKDKRLPELIALRESMDSIVDQIMAHQDIPKRKTKALNKLHRDLNDFNRVMKESGFQRVKRSLTAIGTDPWFSVSGALGTANSLALPPQFQPYIQPLNVATLGACAVKFVYRELNVGKGVPNDFRHFAYLSHMQKEL